MSNHRQVAIDTETTGFHHAGSDRVIEVGAVEIVNRKLTGESFEFRCKPDCLISEGATKVHGITDADVNTLEPFPHFAQKMLEFIAGSDLILFNAPFDLGFLNMEMKRWEHYNVKLEHFLHPGKVIDVMPMARAVLGSRRFNLDAACDHYGISHTGRVLHSALHDAELTALVYLAITRVNLELLGKHNTEQEIRRLTEGQTAGLVVIKATPEELAAELHMAQYMADDPLSQRKKT